MLPKSPHQPHSYRLPRILTGLPQCGHRMVIDPCPLSCCHCIEKKRLWQVSSAQHPGNAGSGALRRMVVVVAWVQLKHRVDPLALIEGLDLLRVLANIPQGLVQGLALPITRREVRAVREML